MNDDPFEDEQVKAYLERARREMFPKLKESALSVMIFNSEPDPKLAIELGAAILFNKPILVLTFKGQRIPPPLRKIAAQVVEIDDIQSAASREKVRAAIEVIMRRPS